MAKAGRYVAATVLSLARCLIMLCRPQPISSKHDGFLQVNLPNSPNPDFDAACFSATVTVTASCACA